MGAGAVGFWSYVRRDNDGDHGRILALAEDLKQQYRIQTAEELELFIDRDSIHWGEAWEQRIDNAIAGTTFFIPIITPSYFRSNACRQELLKFVREAERLGLEQLLMSVYWVRVPELETQPEDSLDEAIRIVARHNWQDLRNESLEERNSSAYRKAVAALARELADRAAQARAVDDVPEPVAEPAARIDDQDAALIERLAQVDEGMSKPMALLRQIRDDTNALRETLEAVDGKLKEASMESQDTTVLLRLTGTAARDLDRPARRIADAGHEYAQVLAELDPGVRARLDLAEKRPVLNDEDARFMGETQHTAKVAPQIEETLRELVVLARSISALSRSLLAPSENLRVGLQGVVDGNAVIEEWERRVNAVFGHHGHNEEM